MRRWHPLWRGFWLAAAMAAGLVLLGATDVLAVFRLERRMLVLLGGIALGAFLGALPGRLRRKENRARHTAWQSCLRAGLCGLTMALALRLAGSGAILPGLMTGSVGAYAFCGAALAAGFVTVRLMERRPA